MRQKLPSVNKNGKFSNQCGDLSFLAIAVTSLDMTGTGNKVQIIWMHLIELQYNHILINA